MKKLKRMLLCFLLAVAILFQTAGCVTSENKDVQILAAESLYNGVVYHYSIALSLKATKILHDGLDSVVSIDTAMALIKKIWEEPPPPQAIVLAIIIAYDVVLFKKTLSASSGPKGVIIDAWGPDLSVENPCGNWFFSPTALTCMDIPVSTPDTSSKTEVITLAIPKKYQEKVEIATRNLDVLYTLTKTIPLYWKITPRN